MNDGMRPEHHAFSAAILGLFIAAGMVWSTVTALVGLNVLGVI